MLQLENTLRTLDAVASESVRVITYFDALTNAHVGVDGLLRGAVTLTGVAAGVTSASHRGATIVDAHGATRTRTATDTSAWPHRELPSRPGTYVWLEREAPAHTNDSMVLDRLAIAVAVALDRRDASPRHSAIEALVGLDASDEERADAIVRLRLDIDQPLRIVAAPASTAYRGPSSTALTEAGLIRFWIAGDEAFPAVAGIGAAMAALRAPASQSSALTALRISSPRRPVIDADEFGPIIDAVPHVAADRTAALASSLAGEPWAFATVDALVSSDSARQCAACLRIHHSTLQARIAQLSAGLGFDIRSTVGRTRLALEFAAYQFRTARIR